MWQYEKKLIFPVNIKKKNVKMAKYIITQLGGPSGELAAAIRYLTQSYTMPTNEGKALLIDIGTEEMAHVEVISTMLYQLTKDATPEELEKEDLGTKYVESGYGIYPTDANGVPFNVYGMGVKGVYFTDLVEDLAAEAKAKATYEALMDLTNEEDILKPLAFLREREIVHFNRFMELLIKYQEKEKKMV